MQALGQASSSGVPDAQTLFMEPEKPGSDLSKRLNAVLRCIIGGGWDPQPGLAMPLVMTN